MYVKWLLLLVIVLAACSKEKGNDGPSGGYFNFKTDGVKTTFSKIALVKVNEKQSAGNYVTSFTAMNESSRVDRPMLFFILHSATPLTTNITYTNFKPVEAGQEKITFMELGGNDQNYKSYIAYPDDYTSLGFKAGAGIRFSELTNKSIRGTFGAVMSYLPDQSYVTITDGEFYITK